MRRRLPSWRALALGAMALVAVATPSAAPTLGPPVPPTGVTAIALTARVEVAWQPVQDATAYRVYRGTSPTTITTLRTTTAGVVATLFSDPATNGTTYYYAVRSIVGGIESASSLPVQVRPRAASCSVGNAVVIENCYPGNTTWRTTNTGQVGAGGIEGFATATSINKGESVDLKVNADDGATFRIEIYRSGYYGGSGARLYSTIRDLPAVRQPGCVTDATTGLIDCSNWSVSATITTTPSWPSGVYLLRLIRNDTSTDNHVLLVVRDDARASDVLYGVAFTDYQGYNGYGGRSMYDWNSFGSPTVTGTARAAKVSFDRPFEQPRSGLRDWYPTIDYPQVYWLEQSGYDVAYQSNTDLETRGDRVRSHRVYFSPAHDEYYSAAMRTALEQGRDAGVHLLFSGSNEIYWKIRFENSPVSGATGRVQVCYKSTQSGGPDPSGIPTGTWRDPAGANKPENALTGVQYVGDKDFAFFPLVVSAAQGADRIWRYTGLDAQAPGTSTSIGTSIVGWEWDARYANGFEPAGVKTLAASPVTGNLIQNNGANSTPGSTTSHVVKYTAASGALVFTAGTNFWARGLARNVDNVGEPDSRIQQATTNVLADMNTLPSTPASNIVLDNPGSRPPAPTGVSAVASGSDTINVSWSPVAGASGYYVWRSVAPREGGQPLGAPANADVVTGTSFSDTGLSSATAYYYVVTSLVAGVQSASSAEASATTAAAAGESTRIDAAGIVDYTSSTGAVFRSDAFFSGGQTTAVTRTIAGTNDQELYRSERWGQFSYAIPVANGTYDLRLHFVELFYGTSAPGGVGKRVFSIDVLDTATSPDLPNVDVWAAVGANRAYVQTIAGVRVTDGILNLRSVYGIADDPELAALEILPQVVPPAVTETFPADAATDVSRLTKPRATFSRAMNAATINGTSFTLVPQGGSAVPATVSYDAATQTATLNPVSALAYSTTYTARVADTVQATDGTRLPAAASWTFTTQAPVPPTATSTFPANGSAGLSPQVRPEVQFSRSLDPATVTPTSFRLLDGGGNAVPAGVVYNDATRTAVLAPSSALTLSGAYTAQLTTAITAVDGVPLASTVSWTFTIAASPPASPTVTATSPADAATQVLVSDAVTATFSREIYASGITTGTFTLSGPSGTVAAGVTYDAATRVARLVPTSRLEPGTTYTARLDSAIHATDGTPLAAAVTWSFTTVPPPTVVARSPVPGQTLISRGSTVTATFSRAIDSTTLGAGGFTLAGSSGVVPAVLAYDAVTRTATLTPTGPLNGGASYTARLETTVIAADGTPLAAPVSWTFFTAACPCSLFAPTLVPASQGLPTKDGRLGSGPWSYEMGVKITVDQPMQVTALRFFKSTGEAGVHVGKLWSVGTGEGGPGGGVNFWTQTFVSETGSGWQEQAISSGSPVVLTPGTVYVASVNVNAFFAMSSGGLQNQVISGPLRSAPGSANGVFASAAGQFPTQSFNSSNYFVDLVTVPDGDPVAPTVVSRLPVAGATAVARDAPVRATFSRPLDPASVDGTSFTLRSASGAGVAATVAYDDASRTATLTPSALLSYSNAYTVELSGGIRARDGVPLVATNWSFVVAPPVTPQVLRMLPYPGVADVGPGTAPRATFSRPLNPLTVDGTTVTLTGPAGAVAGAVSYDATSRAVTFTPASPLADGTHTFRLEGSIQSTDDAPMGSPVSWSFTVTGGLAPASVSASSPNAGANSVPRNAGVTVTFARSMDPVSLTAATFTLTGPGGAAIPATIAYDDVTRVATLTPTALLAPATTYAAQLTTGVVAADRTALGAPVSWSFATAACPCSLFSNLLAPASTALPVQDGRFIGGPWSYELGVKVTVEQPLLLTKIRFFKSAGETGTHTGRVWTSGGTELASVVFVGETASGWQSQALSGSLVLQPGSVYVISVNANAFFSTTSSGMLTQIVSGPLRSVVGANGVHGSAAGVFPTSTWNSSNYFVDLEVVPTDVAPPLVVSTAPVAGAVGVNRSAAVLATFSRPMDATTLTASSLTLTGPAGAVAASVSYDAASRTATLTPSAPLAYSTLYTARLSSAVRALDGVPLAAPVQWSFTVADPVRPTVVTTLPLAGATDVGPSVAPRATFSKSLIPSTVTTTSFTLTGPAGAIVGAVAYDEPSKSATFTPGAPLATGSYTATLAGSITSTDDAAMGTPVSWSFTVTSGLAPPTVTSTTPANGATAVPRNAAVSVAFSRSMDPASLAAGVTLSGAGGPVAATVTYTDATRLATLTPSAPLAAGTTYTASVGTSARGADGTPATPAAWSFTTVACPCTLFSNVLQPESTGLPTQDGRFGTGPWSYELGVKVTVEQPLVVSSLRFFKSPGETGTHTGRVWTAGGTELASAVFVGETASGWQSQALSGSLVLQPGSTYVISVNANAFFSTTSSGMQTQIVSGPLRSVVGANGVHGSAAGVFPTSTWNASNYFVDLEVVPTELAAPTVLSSAPAPGAVGVNRSAPVSATFSRAMEAATLTSSSFTLTGPAGAVAATVAYNAASQTATLTPSAPLAYSTLYTARLSSAVRALDGVPLAAPVQWSFTVADPVRPTVVTTLPLAGATDVGPSVAPRATFSKSLIPSTVTTTSFTLTGPAGAIVGAVAYDEPSKSATFTPASQLAAGSYTATLTGSITSTDDAAMGTPFSWSFTVTTGLAPPSVISTTPANGATGVVPESTVRAAFSRSIDEATLTAASFQLRAADASLVPASISYDSATRTATLTPSSPLAQSGAYTAQVTTGVKATDGTPLAAAANWSFSISACPCSLFSTVLEPASSGNPTSDGRFGAGPWSYELGLKITVDQPVQLTSVRFYKSPGETGVHTARIWSSTGTQLASVVFTGETASGWQQQTLAAPFALQAGSTYTVSVNANDFFVLTLGGLGSQIVNGPLSSVVGTNGVYAETAGTFPAGGSSHNYFVDAIVR